MDYSKFNINMIDFMNENKVQSKTNYALTTSLKSKYTYVFKKNTQTGSWELLHKWISTIGKPSTPTITGEYAVDNKIPKFGMNKGYQAKWATQIKGNYLYHSILYDVSGKYVIDGRLGQELSHGCIRLATENAKWIYDNVPRGSKIIIH